MRGDSYSHGNSFANGQGRPRTWAGGYQGIDYPVNCYVLAEGGGYQ